MIGAGEKGARLDEERVRALCAAAVTGWNVRGRRVLLVVPDQTRTAPMDLMFRVLHELLAVEGGAAACDVLIALGTHPPMSDEAINRRLGISARDRAGRYARSQFLNHRWDDPAQVVSVGTISEDEVAAISGGLMRERVDVTINKLVLDYDLLLIVGPTFPHEVVGFSGGNKYLFPGISGKEIIDMFHWLGALITNPAIIGTKYTPVRAVVDRAAAMVPVERRCISLVVEGTELAGLYAGTPEEAWSAAADLSNRIHVVYKLEPVVADGGELIIYAPHIKEISVVHGALIRQIGYHVRDYFVKQMPRFSHLPRGVVAHSTHVKGIGAYDGGVERPRINVTLATGLSEAECRAVNLGYRDHRSIDAGDWRDAETQGRLLVPKAGETLFRLSDRTINGAGGATGTKETPRG